MATSDRQISKPIVNVLTKAQYQGISNPSADEFYLITDDASVSAGTGISVNATGGETLVSLDTGYAVTSADIITGTDTTNKLVSAKAIADAIEAGGGGGGGGSGTVTGITAGTNLQVGDGTGGDTITTSGTLNHTASGVTAGTYVPSASAKDNTLNLPSFTIDAQGHVTAASNYGYTMTIPTLSHATNSQTYNRNVGGLYYDEYGTIYYRTPFAVTPILNHGSGNDGKSPSSSGHGNPLGYSFFVLTAGQTSMTVKVYDSTYVLSNFGQGWSKFIVTDVVARDAVTKEPIILGWSATEGVDETDIYDDAMTKVSTVTITIGQAYTNNIEFEILYHRIPAAVM